MKNRLARLWRSLLTIRFVFTLLLTGMIALFGWYAVGEFLRYIAGDPTLRVLFIGAETAWVGYTYRTVFVIVGCVFGFALGGAIFRRIEQGGATLRALDPRTKFAWIAGMSAGLFLGAALSLPIILAVPSRVIGVVLALLLTIAASYLTTVAALSMKEEIRFYTPPPAEEEKPPQEKFKILDTNVIIDGRVAEVARAGFLEGVLYVPGFVLLELQHIADLTDDIKRVRGRRGLDVLNQMQKERHLEVGTYDRYAPSGPVDGRLVQLAKALNASLVTNDWNLNRVAELQGVPVLNLNDLASAVKPVVLPDEVISVQLVREGKEALQGIGYLADGTMVVVAGGRNHLGETVDVRVTSLRQNPQGKMIFARIIGDDNEGTDNGDDDDNGNAPRSSGNYGNGYGDRGGNRYGGDARDNRQAGDNRPDSRSGQRRPIRRTDE